MKQESAMTDMIVQASTGLLLAGTDTYFPPFGFWIAQWIARTRRLVCLTSAVIQRRRGRSGSGRFAT